VLFLDAFNEQAVRGVLSTLPFARAGILDIQMLAPVEPYAEVYPDPSPD
jgi:hypothetical protein